MIHNDPSPLAGTTQTIKINVKGIGGQTIEVEDWYDRINGKSWKGQDGNPAALTYAWRAGHAGLPMNDEVVYGKIQGMGYLVNVQELEPSTN